MKPTPIIYDAETEADSHEREAERYSTTPHRHEFVDVAEMIVFVWGDTIHRPNPYRELRSRCGRRWDDPPKSMNPVISLTYELCKNCWPIGSHARDLAEHAVNVDVSRVCVLCSMSEAHAELAARDAERRKAQ